MFTKEDLEFIYHSRPHSFKIVGEPYSESRQTEFVQEMVRQMKEKYKNCEPRPISNIQAASTQAILDRDPAKDKEHFNRPIPENWKAIPDAKTPDEAVGWRLFGEEEIAHIEAIRRRPKNGIEFDDRSAASPEKKEAAALVFLETPGRPLEQLSPRERAVIKSLAKGGTFKTSIEQQENKETTRNFAKILKGAGMAAEFGYAQIRIPVESE